MSGRNINVGGSSMAPQDSTARPLLYQPPNSYAGFQGHPNYGMVVNAGDHQTKNPDPMPNVKGSSSTSHPNFNVTNIETWTSSSKVYLHIKECLAYIGVCTEVKSCLIPAICRLLMNKNIDVLSVESSQHGIWKSLSFKIRVSAPFPGQILKGNALWLLYKDAADAIALIV